MSGCKQNPNQTKPEHAYPDKANPRRKGHYECGGCGESDDTHPKMVPWAGAAPGPWPCDGYDWVSKS